MPPSPCSPRGPVAWNLFLLSFLGLFLELMLIRWAPSAVTLVAYYSNLLLLSSFFGLGLGAMLASRGTRLFQWFPLVLSVDIVFLLTCQQVGMGGGFEERFFVHADAHAMKAVLLVLLFLLNAAVFVPIGQRLGELFASLPNLRAYAWDLGGSLLGSVCFGVFSLFHFSPVTGLAIVGLVYALQVPRKTWLWLIPSWAVLVVLVAGTTVPGSVWSPYHFITVKQVGSPAFVEEPPAELRTMRNPPAYTVAVNTLFYQLNLSQDLGRYDAGNPVRALVASQVEQYDLPYAVSSEPKSVLVLGSGGGADVQGALRHNVEKVDAVDIDPRLIEISRRFNPDAPYDDPRVSVHVDDARSYIATTKKRYDLVVFGFLDSQALFSSMSNVRIDGYVYTVESLRAAYRLLNERGVLTLSFTASNWMALKLHRTLEEATGGGVVSYIHGTQVVLCVGPGLRKDLPAQLGQFRKIRNIGGEITLATDDWPYLYLSGPGIPMDYLVAILSLLVCSVLGIIWARGRKFGLMDTHFALLGMGFMLLETKSVGDCALYFGNTWLVTMLVISGVLLMVLLANAVAARMNSFSPALYIPLIASLLVLWLVPRDWVLGYGLEGRLLWVLLVTPLPVFFAGLIFSTTFREMKDSAGAFGANLLGAMVGGFGEYLGMWAGTKALSLLIIAAYLASRIVLAFRAR